ncbi:hypothetical protein Bca52824_095958 [Brassica carinata]|uniref:Uncharacterized protein n=1 Tax=Brassica carinata TaxID=52824 RepID=A0A8X7P0S1_BRACI|nr:hypothetical protein Bca52824_095958 [Brassica carinata]
MEPRQPQQARAPRLPDRPQGLWPDGPRRLIKIKNEMDPPSPSAASRRDLRLADEHRRVQRARVLDEDRGGSKETTITSPHMFVIKDLVVDMTNFIISIRVSSRG